MKKVIAEGFADDFFVIPLRHGKSLGIIINIDYLSIAKILYSKFPEGA